MQKKLKLAFKVVAIVLFSILALYFVIGLIGLAIGNSDLGYGLAVPFFGLPIVLFILGILWVIVETLPSFIGVFSNHQTSSRTHNKRSLKALAYLSVAFILFGLFLVLWFILAGGLYVHNAGNVHIFNSHSNHYLDLQIGFLSIIAGSVLALVVTKIHRNVPWLR
jgi:hypothetical protein